MLKIMNFPNQYQVEKKENLEETKFLKRNTSNSNIELADYKTGQALLAQSGINFKESVEPLEITSNYNKKTEGYAGLDLPNIHIYEYPNTNLQVFINETPVVQDKNTFHTSLSLINKNTNNSSVVKQTLFMQIIDKYLQEHNINAKVNQNYTNFINIDYEDNISNINNIQTLNKLIVSPNITQRVLEECKQSLIEYINSEKYEKETAEIKKLIDKSLLSSKESVIKEIKNTTLSDIYNYHSDILKNTEMQCFLTIDQDFMKNNKNIFTILNSNISNKFQKHSNNSISALKTIEQNKNTKIYDNQKGTYLSLHYPVNIESNKDKLIYKYLTLLEIFYKSPYVSENSAGHNYLLPLELNSNFKNLNSLGFLELNFTPNGEESITSTDNAIEVFQAILESLYTEEKVENTLESIKEYEKTLYAEWLNGESNNKNAHELLHNYGYDIFKIYEIIDDVKMKDIQEAIEKTFFKQKPVVIVNETLNPYN